MKRIILYVILMGILLVGMVLPAFAQTTTFSGTISAGTPLTGGRPSNGGLGCTTLSGGTRYYDLQSFTAPASGTWNYVDLMYANGSGDLWVSFYTGTFDPTSPLGGGCFANFDDGGGVSLTAGTTYTIMVSTNGASGTGSYQFALSNDPTTSVALGGGPTLTPGRPNFHGVGSCSPTTTGTYYYALSQFTPSVSADYTYSDVGYRNGTGLDMEIDFYTGSIGTFDPTNPTGNGCIANFDDIGTVHLDAGVTYTILVTNHSSGGTGTTEYLLLGPGTGVGNCPYPLPAGGAVHSIPNGAPAFWAPDLSDGTGFNIPAGTWWITGTSGDFSHVWVACEAQPVWVPTNAVAP